MKKSQWEVEDKMPLIKGHSQEVVSKNIGEMMKAGHSKAQAVAASLASARKYKKMAKGGMVEDSEDDGEKPELSMTELAQMKTPEYDNQYREKEIERPYKKMAHGGMVDNDDPMVPHKGHGAPRSPALMVSMGEMDRKDPEDYLRNPYELQKDAEYHPEEIANPNELEESNMFAKALREKAMDEDMDTEHFAMGGLVEGDHDSPVGNKPSEDMRDSTEEPMSSMPGREQGPEHRPTSMEPSGPGLSQAAKDAIERRKKSRRFMMVSE